MALQSDIFSGDARDSNRGEFASTPSWVIRPALEMLPQTAFGRILDAGAGLGDLGIATENYSECVRSFRPSMTAVELYSDRCALLPDHWDVHQHDFLEWAPRFERLDKRFDLTVCNPPFTQWLQWAQLNLKLLASKGCLLMVGPVEYLAGVERGEWMGDSTPKRVHVHCKRPKGNGWELTRGVMVVTWQQGHNGGTDLFWVK